MNRTMTREEIMNSSLPYCSAVAKEISEIRMASMGFGGMLGKKKKEVAPEKVFTPDTADEAADYINSLFKS